MTLHRYSFDIWDGHRRPDQIVCLLPSDDDARAHAAEIAISHVVEQDGPIQHRLWRITVKNERDEILRTIELGSRSRPLHSHFTVQ